MLQGLTLRESTFRMKALTPRVLLAVPLVSLVGLDSRVPVSRALAVSM